MGKGEGVGGREGGGTDQGEGREGGRCKLDLGRQAATVFTRSHHHTLAVVGTGSLAREG